MTDWLDDIEAETKALLATGWASRPKSDLDLEEAAIAARLLGKANADRRARHRGGKRFQMIYTRRVEYWLAPTGWVFEAYEGPSKRIIAKQVFAAECEWMVAELERRGYLVRLVETERMREMARLQALQPPPPPPPPDPARWSTPSKKLKPSKARQHLAQLAGWRA